MRKTFSYRVTINKNTEANCNQWLETCRTLYNLALDQRISVYRQYRKTLSGYDQSRQLPELKKSFPQFKEVDAQCLQDVIDRLDKAFQAFFRRIKSGDKPGFPRFKGFGRYDSFTLKQKSWKLNGKILTIRNVGIFKLFLSRPIEGKIKTVTVKRSITGKWFVYFSCDNVPEKSFPKTEKSIGLDVGIKSFLVDSNGEKVDNPKFLLQSEKIMRRRQRSLCRKNKGSVRRKDTRTLVAKCHEKITNQRKDFLHKVSNHYIKYYDTISVEDLKIRNMVRNPHLAKSISDSSWGLFFSMLFYKAEEAGRTVIKVAPQNTSQNCSACGEKVVKSLSVRVHRCPFCGLTMDRDHNAALNILSLGQRDQALTDRLLTTVA